MADFSAYINLEEGLKRLGGNKKILARLLGTFEKDKNYDELLGALEENDITKASNAAHAIKGMSANLSMTALYEASTIYEQELKEGVHNPALFDAFRDAREKTLESLEAAKQELNT